MKNKISLIAIFLLLLSGVSALTLQASPQEYFKAGNFTLNYMAYDSEGLELSNTSLNCYIKVFNSDNKLLQNANLSYSTYFYFNAENYEKGDYSYILSCNNATVGEALTGSFKVTESGQAPLTETINTYPLLFFFIGLWLVGGIYFLITPFKFTLQDLAENQGKILLKCLSGVASTGALWLLYSLAYIKVTDGASTFLFSIPQLNSFILALGILQTPLIIYFVVWTFARYLMEK